MRPSPSLSLRIRAHASRHDTPQPKAPVQSPVTAAYYRGGTSRAVIFQPQHLPRDRAAWPSLFRQVMGSGDAFARQLDGMGAGLSSLSKVCLVEPHGPRRLVPRQALADRIASHGVDAARALIDRVRRRGEAVGGVDVDYTFVGLGIESDQVDVAGNCGNMSSAIGPYAYNAGLLPPRIYAQGNGPVTVTIRNTNTGKLIASTFDVAGGQAAVVGDYTIDGVTGPGAKIRLDFKDPYGSKTGKVLPTGNKVDRVLGYNVTCVDGANPCVFIRASDVGVDGTILPNDFNKLPDKLALLERIRKAAAVAMGIAPTHDAVPRTIPKIGLISMSSAHPVLSGHTLQTSQTDLVVRFLSDTQPHRAIPLTAALTTAVAARIPGTLVEQLLAPDPVVDGTITIGHASGRLQVDATMDKKDSTVPVNGTVYRTAKRLFEGTTFWTDNVANKPSERALRSIHGTNGTHSLGMAFVLESRGQSIRELFEGEEEEAEPVNQLPEIPEEPARTSTEQAQIQPKHSKLAEKLAPTPISYQRTGQVPLLPDHAPTPLTNALTQLHTHLSNMLADPDLSTRSHPKTLVDELESAYKKILATKGTQWHQWAKALAKQKKSLRISAEKKEKAQKKLEHGVESTTRKQVGLDKWGRPIWDLRAKKERKEKTAKEKKGEEMVREESSERDDMSERKAMQEMIQRDKAREARWERSTQTAGRTASKDMQEAEVAGTGG
jgi:2-methylaconitate cis-trans-isomerase PrpF